MVNNSGNKALINETLMKRFGFWTILIVFSFCFLNSFVSRYDLGSNIDDKAMMYSSSYLAFMTEKERIELFNQIITPNIQKDINLNRYELRFNNVSNYLGISALNRIIFSALGGSSSAISIAFFYSLVVSFFVVVVFYLYIYNTSCSRLRSFLPTYAIVVFLSNHHIFPNDLFELRDLLFDSSQRNGNFSPLIYVPRGQVALMVPVVLLSILQKRVVVFLSAILFMFSIHLIMGLFVVLCVLPFLFFQSIVGNGSIKNMLVALSLLVAGIIFWQSYFVFGYRDMLDTEAMSLDKFNLSDAIGLLQPITVSIFSFTLYVFSRDSEVRSLAFFATYMILGLSTLTYLSDIGFVDGDFLKQRFQGLFNEVIIASLVFGAIQLSSAPARLSKKLRINLLSLLLTYFVIKFMFFTTINLFNHNFVLLSQSISKIGIIHKDVDVWVENYGSELKLPSNREEALTLLSSKFREPEFFLVVPYVMTKNQF